MIMVAMLAMMLLAAAPAFAQDAGDAVATDGSMATGGDFSVVFVTAPQLQLALGVQQQLGDASASGSAAMGGIHQSVMIHQSQMSGGF